MEINLLAEPSVKNCSNPKCSHRLVTGRVAEFNDHVSACSDCGAVLNPENSGRERADGHHGPWLRLGVTIAAGFGSLLARQIPVPGSALAFERDSIGPPAGVLSIVSLGLTPVFVAFVIVEIAAILFRPLRSARTGGPQGRVALLRLIIPVALLAAGYQASLTFSWLREMGPLHGWGPWSALGLLPLGTLGLVLLARAVDQWGIGQGFSVMIFTNLSATLLVQILNACERMALQVDIFGSLHHFLLVFDAGDQHHLEIQLAFVGTILASWLLASAAGTPNHSDRGSMRFDLPTSGIWPLSLPALFFAIPAIPGLARFDQLLNRGSWLSFGVEFALVVTGAIILSLLFNLPSQVASVRAGGDSAALANVKRALKRSNIGSAAFLGCVAALMSTTLAVESFFDCTAAVILTFIARDLWEEWWFRRQTGSVSAVWPIHRVYAAQPALAALAEAGIPGFAQGRHHRALLQFFGPYIPIRIMVARADEERAAAVLETLLR